MFSRSLVALLIVLFAGSVVAQDKNVDCKKVPDHPNCAPRA